MKNKKRMIIAVLAAAVFSPLIYMTWTVPDRMYAAYWLGSGEFRSVTALEWPSATDREIMQDMMGYQSFSYKKDRLPAGLSVSLYLCEKKQIMAVCILKKVSANRGLSIHMVYAPQEKTVTYDPVAVLKCSDDGTLQERCTDSGTVREFLEENGISEADIRKLQNDVWDDIVIGTWVESNGVIGELEKMKFHACRKIDHTFN